MPTDFAVDMTQFPRAVHPMLEMSETFVGFDSAWTDKVKAPGAICALRFEPNGLCFFYPPTLVNFAEALTFSAEASEGSDYLLLALDQPTIVPNMTSLRPVERVAASLISWVGGGVQPANRSKVGMFCDNSPIWPFLRDLAAVEDPEAARLASAGRFLIEVFPALALPTFDERFCARLAAPRYNPANRRRFSLAHWSQVAKAAAARFAHWGLRGPEAWCNDASNLNQPRKADQDKLDAMLCLLVGLQWRKAPREESLMIGDTQTGYMILPASSAVRERLTSAASKCRVSVDGKRQSAPL